MKKWLCIFVSALLQMALFVGCTQTPVPTEPAKPTAVLQVGFGRADISPKTPVSLTGYGDQATRISKGTAEDAPLMSTCIAFTDSDGNTVLLFYNDLSTSGTDVISDCRQAVSEATGISVDNIMSSATHIHSAPSLLLTNNLPGVAEFAELLKSKMVEAAQAALADRANAKMYTTTTQTADLNYIRHYNMKDGTVSGDNFGNKASGYDSHVGEPDRSMSLVKFTREGKKDIVLVNFQTHPHRQGIDELYNYAHSDLVGIMRNELEAAKDCYFAYFTGAAGNINPSGKLRGEKVYANFREHGKAMADYAIKAYDSFAEVEVGKVQILKNVYHGTPKSGTGTVQDVIMYAFSIGDVAFVCAPYEMFDENGVAIKAGSPFKMTLISTYTNYHVKYIPSVAGFEYEGTGLSYEGRVCMYKKGTGEELATKYIEMLNTLYETKN